jgi:hypothetical protein
MSTLIPAGTMINPSYSDKITNNCKMKMAAIFFKVTTATDGGTYEQDNFSMERTQSQLDNSHKRWTILSPSQIA